MRDPLPDVANYQKRYPRGPRVFTSQLRPGCPRRHVEWHEQMIASRVNRWRRRLWMAIFLVRGVAWQQAFLLGAMAWCLLAYLSPGACGGADYRVGVARVDITPSYPVRLNGFGFRRSESEGVYQRIWAKAIAIQHGDDPPVVLVTLDSLGIRESMVNEVARRLQQDGLLTRPRLAVAFSHSHTTPKVRGASDTIFSNPIPPEHQERIDRYTDELTDALEKVCRDALADLQPGRLAWAVGTVTFAKNRRTKDGPVDHSLPVLAVYGAEDRLRAVLVSYACHCVTLSHNQIGGDWAGFAQEIIERKLDGVTALVSIGCGSDANPDSGVTGDKIEVAVAQGQQIADEVARVLQGEQRPVSGPILAQLTYVDLPLEPPPKPEELEALAQQNTAAGYNARFQLERLSRGEKLLEAIDYPVQTFSFGSSLHMVFLAGEVCVDYALRLRKELDPARLWLHGYSNDFCAYIPSERLLQEGGYGGGSEVVYFALPSRFRPGLEEQIVEAVRRSTPKEFHATGGKGTQGVPPKAPDESLKCFQLDDRFRIELVAAEPIVADPVAIDFAPDGSLWVLEMPDYSREVDEPFTPSGRVKRLTDADGDGHYDTATLFLQGLRFPTGITVWRDGVLICDAPSIFFARDSDADGKADQVKTLYTGFATHNPHARVNSLRYGVDGWVYGSSGLFGGQITSFSEASVTLERQDFRIQPDLGTIEPAAGVTQQGRCRDDWDNWFGCDNSNLARHYPVFDHYLRRNRFAAAPATQVSVPVDSQAARLYPAGPLVLFKLSGPPGRATSACGIDVYRDVWLGDDLYGNLFTCEPVHQAVHRLVVSRQGATFRGRRANGEASREFLSSTDQWFRPVQVRTGPDGALWIVDMYRYVIEHKRWIPPETLSELDLMAGSDRGRIYRVVRADTTPPTVPNLLGLPETELATKIDHPNGTLRDLVQQLLLWSTSGAARPALEHVVRHGQNPAGRLQALWTLALKQWLDEELLLAALEDDHPGVRRQALRIAENWAGHNEKIAAAIVHAASDPDYEVRYQSAYSLGFCPTATAAAALARLALQHADDPYMVSAVASSLRADNSRSVVQTWHSAVREATPQQRRVFAELVAVDVLLRGEQAVADALGYLVNEHPTQPDAVHFDSLRRLIEAVRRAGVGETLLRNSAGFLVWIQAARQSVQEEVPLPVRRSAVSLLGSWGDRADIPSLADLVSPQQPPELQRSALEALLQMSDGEVAERLIAAVEHTSPAMQLEIIDTLMRRNHWTIRLLAAVQEGRVPIGLLDAARRQQLLAHPQEEIRKHAKEIFDSGARPRQQVLDLYQLALRAPGDADRGQAIYLKHCATCHRWGELGQAVGPDLSAMATKSPLYLLNAILDPNREVEPRFVSYVVVTREGQTFTGLLTDESATSITLLGAEGKTQQLLRADIDQLRSTGKSLMPEGLENEVTPQQMADLIALLMGSAVPPKQFPGNHPAVVAPDEKGVFRLAAEQAEIYGRDICYETAFQNIGHWHDARDYVLWRLNVPKTQTYRLTIEWACADHSAGNTLLIEGFDKPVSWRVPSTGGWDRYERQVIATVTLPAGQPGIIVRPSKTFHGPALLDLRGLILTPSQ